MTIKKVYKKIALSALVIGSFTLTSCNDDETVAREGKPTVTVLNKTQTMTEGYGGYTAFNFSYPIKEEAQVRVEIVGGTAEEGVDFEMNLATIEDAGFGFFGGEGYFASMPAFSKQYYLIDFIRAIEDNDAEGTDETVMLKFTSVSKGTILINEVVTFTIKEENNTDSYLRVTYDFTEDFTVDGTTYAGCDLDFDLSLSTDPVDNEQILTSFYDCPESFDIPNTPGALGAAPVYIFTDIWNRGPLPAIEDITTHIGIPNKIVAEKLDDANDSLIDSAELSLADEYSTRTLPSDVNASISEKSTATIFSTGDQYLLIKKANGENQTVEVIE